MNRAFTRDTYNRVRKFDRRQMQAWAETLYAEGYKDGAASVPGVDAERIYEAVSGIRGIGPKKLQEIRDVVDKLLLLPEIRS